MSQGWWQLNQVLGGESLRDNTRNFFTVMDVNEILEF